MMKAHVDWNKENDRASVQREISEEASRRAWRGVKAILLSDELRQNVKRVVAAWDYWAEQTKKIEG